MHRCRGLRIETMFWNPWNGQMDQFFPLWKRPLSSGEEPTSGLPLLTTGQHRQEMSPTHPLSDSDMLWGLKSTHSHAVKQRFSRLCFLVLLLCAGTRRRTKPARRWNGGAANCLLLGWLLNSCFGYDITAFKLQTNSISELKTYRLFHKKARARC